jgi:hypothetical protein
MAITEAKPNTSTDGDDRQDQRLGLDGQQDEHAPGAQQPDQQEVDAALGPGLVVAQVADLEDVGVQPAGVVDDAEGGREQRGRPDDPEQVAEPVAHLVHQGVALGLEEADVVLALDPSTVE